MRFSEDKIKLWTTISIVVIASYTFLLGLTADAPACPRLSREKVEIVKILGDRVQPADAVAIANTVLEQSRQTGISVPVFLAIMKKESSFRVDACSSCNARGIMQIHPAMWKAYSNRLDLPPEPKNAFNPSHNIAVASVILTDLLGRYRKRGYQEHRLWDYVLAAYYAGPTAIRGGLKYNHRQYVKKVRQYEREVTLAIG